MRTFFATLSNVRLVWQIVEEGNAVEEGVVNNLGVAPQQKVAVSLGYTLKPTNKERFLEVRYVTKKKDGMVPAGHTVARQQLSLNGYQFDSLEMVSCGDVSVDETRYLIEVQAGLTSIGFDKKTGYIISYKNDGAEFLKEGELVKPNFWRGPTDNDYGARFQNKLSAWRNPVMKLKALKAEEKAGNVVVNATYDLTELEAQLKLSYEIAADGKMKIHEALVAGENKDKKPMLPRFGMQLPLKKQFEDIEYYGRGPVENYVDRKNSTFIDRFEQTVSEQFFSYIRPQETGTKSDVRWWKLTAKCGKGVKVYSDAPFYASALHFKNDDLDDFEGKDQRHSGELEEQDLTILSIDGKQMGLGCINTWGAYPMEKYRLPYGDYEFTFIIEPMK